MGFFRLFNLSWLASPGFNASPDFDVLKPFDPCAASTTAGAPVPGSVDVAPPGKLGRRGVAMYRTHFVQNGRPPGSAERDGWLVGWLDGWMDGKVGRSTGQVAWVSG